MVFPISGFTAVPNPVMLSFMGAQSFIMMYMAGEAWQFGKRKISAMTNEEFNKLTPLDLLKEQQSTLKEAIPSMEKSMQDMTPMFETITAEMLKAIPPIVKAVGDVLPSVIGETQQITETAVFGETNPKELSFNEYHMAVYKSIIDFLTTNKGATPASHMAEARLGTGARQKDLDVFQNTPSGFIGPSKETNNQRAARLQAEHNEAVRKRKAAEAATLAENARLQKLNVHQIVADRNKAQGVIIKRAAGQTVRQKRDYYIRIIAALLAHSKRQGISPSQRASFNKQRINAQEQLAGLLARYRF